ncbi:MAG: class I SAM-dependent methyltransferase [bacterium]|nr:class I SAM-dependent methyltransferase [bacterium]
MKKLLTIFTTQKPEYKNTHHQENAFVYDDYYRSGIIDGWEDHDKAYNFSNLFKIFDKTKRPLRGASILDIGCGTGDILPYLWEKSVGQYVGTDIYKPALQLARKKYPKEIFLFTDILKDENLGRFDFVVSSGAMSIRLESVNNYDFLQAMVRKMWQLCRFGIAFNLLTDEDVAPASHLFYYSIEKVRAICKKIAPDAKVSIRRTPINNGKGFEDEAQIHVYMTQIRS